MRLEQLNFHHLFYFWRVASLGHLTRAAQALHTSQSALSAQIRQLEDRIGQDLFTREGRRLVLTDTGQLVFSYADTMFGLGQEMLGRLQGHTEGITRLRVGSVATVSRNYQDNWLRPVLANPNVMLTLETGTLEALVARLVAHKLDVVLANDTPPAHTERALHCQLLGSQAVALVGPSAQWANTPFTLPCDLDGQDIALPGPRHALRARLDALCSAAGVAPRVRAEVDDMAMLRLIARDSGWLTALPEVVVQDELRQGSLVVVARFLDVQEHFYAITTPQRYRLELLDTLIGGQESKQDRKHNAQQIRATLAHHTVTAAEINAAKEESRK